MTLLSMKNNLVSFLGFFIGNEIALFTFLRKPDQTVESIIMQGLVTSFITIIIVSQLKSIFSNNKKTTINLDKNSD